MNQANMQRAAVVGTGLSAVPPTVPEIESETQRLQEAISVLDGAIGDLEGRLHSVRADRDSNAPAEAKEIGPATKLGSTLRGASDAVDRMTQRVRYQLRTLELPA